MELFEQAKKKRSIDKKDLNHDDAELMKNPEAFTFQPNKERRDGNRTQRNMSPEVKRQENAPGYAQPRG